MQPESRYLFQNIHIKQNNQMDVCLNLSFIQYLNQSFKKTWCIQFAQNTVYLQGHLFYFYFPYTHLIFVTNLLCFVNFKTSFDENKFYFFKGVLKSDLSVQLNCIKTIISFLEFRHNGQKFRISTCKIFIKKVIFSYIFLLVLNSVKPQIISWFCFPLMFNVDRIMQRKFKQYG